VPLTASEGMVMRYLQANPVAAPNQIASAAGLQRSNLSTLLRGLETKGLVERHTSADDRRGVMVRLTERGAKNYVLVPPGVCGRDLQGGGQRYEQSRGGAQLIG